MINHLIHNNEKQKLGALSQTYVTSTKPLTPPLFIWFMQKKIFLAPAGGSNPEGPHSYGIYSCRALLTSTFPNLTQYLKYIIIKNIVCCPNSILEKPPFKNSSSFETQKIYITLCAIFLLQTLHYFALRGKDLIK